MQDRIVSKMYAEAVRALPKGRSMLDADAFVSIARTFGLDRWRVEAGAGGGQGRGPGWYTLCRSILLAMLVSHCQHNIMGHSLQLHGGS